MREPLGLLEYHLRHWHGQEVTRRIYACPMTRAQRNLTYCITWGQLLRESRQLPSHLLSISLILQQREQGSRQHLEMMLVKVSLQISSNLWPTIQPIYKLQVLRYISRPAVRYIPELQLLRGEIC